MATSCFGLRCQYPSYFTFLWEVKIFHFFSVVIFNPIHISTLPNHIVLNQAKKKKIKSFRLLFSSFNCINFTVGIINKKIIKPFSQNIGHEEQKNTLLQILTFAIILAVIEIFLTCENIVIEKSFGGFLCVVCRCLRLCN